jgi:hypothetical protein
VAGFAGNSICVAAADLNGDGNPDLVSANWYDGTLTVLTNNGHGAFGFNARLSAGYSPILSWPLISTETACPT